MKNYKLILTGTVLAAVMGCTNPETYEAPAQLEGVCGEFTANKTVQSITSTSTSATTKYVDDPADGDDYIEAYVTSSDKGGNFYKSISFVSVDGTVGFSIPIDDYNLYSKYAPGRKVYIKLKDTYYTKLYGSTVIGALYNNETPSIANDDKVGRISGISYQDILTASCSSSVTEEALLNRVTIAQAKSDAYLNKLIELDNVQFSDASLGKKYYAPELNSLGGATNHNVVDADGNSVILRASQYATFAANDIPSGSGKIVGVMTKYNSDYQFMIRTIGDVKLDNDRILPYFYEPFTTNFPNWRLENVTGAQQWTLETINGNKCVTMNGYQGGNVQNEDWLISPAQNLSDFSSATLSFDTALSFSGNSLVVLISRNYPGTGNPNAAGVTWTTLNGTLATSSSSTNPVWKGSGNININSFTGAGNNNVYVAFKYTSTTSAAAKWGVDNVRINAN